VDRESDRMTKNQGKDTSPGYKNVDSKYEATETAIRPATTLTKKEKKGQPLTGCNAFNSAALNPPKKKNKNVEGNREIMERGRWDVLVEMEGDYSMELPGVGWNGLRCLRGPGCGVWT